MGQVAGEGWRGVQERSCGSRGRCSALVRAARASPCTARLPHLYLSTMATAASASSLPLNSSAKLRSVRFSASGDVTSSICRPRRIGKGHSDGVCRQA